MINFFQGPGQIIYAVDSVDSFTPDTIQKLNWLFAGSFLEGQKNLKGYFLGPRKEMVTPWSTNAVEITLNMGINGIIRIESFDQVDDAGIEFDAMLQFLYKGLDQELFSIYHEPEPIIEIDDITAYNKAEGLALSSEEIEYLNGVSEQLGRKLTDSEVFGFSQVNSEHCRHKIFNGQFIIDGKEMPDSLFGLIKKTSKVNSGNLISAYKDNVAFIKGPIIEQFAPNRQDVPEYFVTKDIDSVISLKAETHNFPTTVEPFNGASTGTGGEIRDRMAGGKGSIPMAGTAVYMTSYSRLEKDRPWEKDLTERQWLYQSPIEILIKASNGASDFGNKFGQPLICGSLLTFEHSEHGKDFGYDKVIMLAGGIGYGRNKDSLKDVPHQQDRIIMMGGDNYRIGMGGGAVSSVATGEYGNQIELNAVQRANPEMQKRVYNAIRALSELEDNPIVSLHDHGAGGHLNCFSELVEDTGGVIHLDNLPVGDPTLSSKEIIGNESQERMGMILKEKDIRLLKDIADRERAPMFDVGRSTGDHQLTFETSKNNSKPIDWKVEHMFGNPPRTIINDASTDEIFEKIDYDRDKIKYYIEQLLQIEAVACKDWLTNKVDRSVTGKIAHQQTCGPLQLPLNNLGAVALDYKGISGIATAIGHAPVGGLQDPARGSVLSVVEALTNIIWAPLNKGLENVSLSANWMWPCKNSGEDARLYKAVKAVSDFSIKLGINVPTGKDSLSMTQKYKDGKVVYSPGTVIISAAAEITNIHKIVSTDAQNVPGSDLYYIFVSDEEFNLGGSSFAQLLNRIGPDIPGEIDAEYFKKVFNAIQELVNQELILAGHDVSAGGLITTLLEMVFASNKMAFNVDFSSFTEKDTIKILFSEKPGLVIQGQNDNKIDTFLDNAGINYLRLGNIITGDQASIQHGNQNYLLDVAKLRDLWFKTSFLLDQRQTLPELAEERFTNYRKHELNFKFPNHFDGELASLGLDINRRKQTGIKAAIIREKGVNGDREMAYSMHLAGFDVKDVHMTDLISGRETLEDVNFIVFVGGFSNSDVLGSAKGWAGAFLYNEKAKLALEKFYARPDTLSLGVCNGCQLMVELGLIYPDIDNKPRMLHNESGKFESSFLMIDVLPNNSIMLNTLTGSSLGIWVAHGEGKFHLELPEENYHIPAKYSYSSYPANPNGSDYNAACIASADGRHLAIMPHLERAIFPWQWGYYPYARKMDEISPWLEAFVNAKRWILNYQADEKS
jgi:phosphoribosylformylglycinamidine synthase